MKIRIKSIKLLCITLLWSISIMVLSGCQTKPQETESAPVVVDTVQSSVIDIKPEVITYNYDTLLYGKHSKMIYFGRSSRKDSSVINDTIVYCTNLKETQDFRSLDLQMNLLRGPVKAIYIKGRTLVNNRAINDSTWRLIYKPFSNAEFKKTDSTRFDIYGKLTAGSVVYNSWQINAKTKAKVKRDAFGNIKDVIIDAKEYGTFGGRYFYDADGFLKYYNVRGWEDGYRLTNNIERSTLKSYEMEGISEGEPYIYKRFFSIIDTDQYGNWTIRVCTEHYYPGNLYIREGQENEENKWNISEDDAELLSNVAEWQNSLDKTGPVSQFAVFEDKPQKVRKWVELRKIIYY